MGLSELAWGHGVCKERIVILYIELRFLHMLASLSVIV